MSVPPQIAQALTAGGPKPPAPGPGGGPMMAPSPKEGNLAGARADVQICIKKLTQSLQVFQPTSHEGKEIMKAIGTLVKAFGETEGTDKELMPAEINQGLASLAGPGKPPPGLPQPAGPAPIPPPM